MSQQSHALVDMKNANFSDYWVDIIIPGKKTNLRVDRTYNSRSLFSGIFGFGWCSQFESRLDITMEGNVLLNDCLSTGLIYYPSNQNKKLMATSSKKIVALLKKKYPKKSAKYFTALKSKMMRNSKILGQYAGEVGYRIAPTKGTLFYANGNTIDKIIFNGSHYIRTLPDKSRQKYSASGRLLTIYDTKNNSIKLSYSGKKLTQISNNEGLKVTLTYDLNNRLKKIIGPKKVNASYQFVGEDLTRITNGWNNNYKYKYDSNHNMVRVDYPDQTVKKISYNEKKDWVQKFVDRKGCSEKFSFILSKSNPKDHFWSTSRKYCSKKNITKSKYEFWYAKRKDKQKYLSRMLSDRDKKITDISFHAYTGKPISIREGALLTRIDYLPSGLLHTKSVSPLVLRNNGDKKYTIRYQYDKRSRVIKTAADYYNKSNQIQKSLVTNYAYDKLDRLVSARNSSGEKIQLRYNSLGLISKLKGNKKETIEIKYNRSVRKPASIIKPKVGSIDVVYDETGNIKSIKNTGGQSAASKVATTFNNFLEMISPATSELSLNL